MKFLFLTGLMFLLSATCIYADVSLKFGVYTADKPTSVVRQFRPILNLLEKKMTQNLGEKVSIKMKVSNTYEKGLNDIINGDVDFFRSGPATYILASRKNSALSILAVESNKGKKQFNGVICIHANSSITSVKGLKGKSFAFGDPQSTIGRYLAQLYLHNQGVQAKDLSDYQYLNRHDLVGTAVAANKFDAGALKESTFNKLVKSGKPIKALATFPNVTKPWYSRSDLEVRIQSALSAALLSIGDKKVLKPLKKDGFLKGSDKDYQIIRESMDKNGAFFK